LEDQANKQEKNKRRERKKIETEPVNVSISSNIGNTFDPYRDIRIVSPEPIFSFDSSKVKLYVKKDTSFVRISPKIKPDTTNFRRYLISYPWDFGTNYRLTIDSTALHTIYGLYGKAFKIDFKTQDEDHYGKIIYSIQNVKGPTIIQILENNKEETVVKSVTINKDQEITIPFLEPKKYLMKAIFDRNNNGVWDSGNLKEKSEPEEVCYYLSVIKVRSNWDSKSLTPWILPDPANFRKKIIDVEAEAEKLNMLKKKKNQPQKTNIF
jgi:hypothetical protein